MGSKTGIAWTEKTWNPVIGCTKVTAGCDRCYAISTATRMGDHPAYAGTVAGGEWTGRVNLVEDRLGQPLRWMQPSSVFVNAQSDLFHSSVDDEFAARVFAVMAVTPRHTFQVLTKRPARMRALLSGVNFLGEDFPDVVASVLPPPYVYDARMVDPAFAERQARKLAAKATPYIRVYFDWPLPNVHLGVTVENEATLWRVGDLVRTPAAHRFISAEPLLSALTLPRFCACGCKKPFKEVELDVRLNPGYLNQDQALASLRSTLGVDQVIVGGESGVGARLMEADWARSIRDQCAARDVPFFMKQMGSAWAALNGASGKADQLADFPEDLRIRQGIR